MSVRGDRRAIYLIGAAASVLGALCLPGPAQATSRSVGDVPDPMYQTNGKVDAVLSVGDTIYIGGTFTSVRPAGAPAGTDEVSRSRLAAFSRSTGALLRWNPGVGHQVNALAAAPNGRIIYVGGRFHAARWTAPTQPRRRPRLDRPSDELPGGHGRQGLRPRDDGQPRLSRRPLQARGGSTALRDGRSPIERSPDAVRLTAARTVPPCPSRRPTGASTCTSAGASRASAVTRAGTSPC